MGGERCTTTLATSYRGEVMPLTQSPQARFPALAYPSWMFVRDIVWELLSYPADWCGRCHARRTGRGNHQPATMGLLHP